MYADLHPKVGCEECPQLTEDEGWKLRVVRVGRASDPRGPEEVDEG